MATASLCPHSTTSTYAPSEASGGASPDRAADDGGWLDLLESEEEKKMSQGQTQAAWDDGGWLALLEEDAAQRGWLSRGGDRSPSPEPISSGSGSGMGGGGPPRRRGLLLPPPVPLHHYYQYQQQQHRQPPPAGEGGGRSNGGQGQQPPQQQHTLAQDSATYWGLPKTQEESAKQWAAWHQQMYLFHQQQMAPGQGQGLGQQPGAVEEANGE